MYVIRAHLFLLTSHWRPLEEQEIEREREERDREGNWEHFLNHNDSPQSSSQRSYFYDQIISLALIRTYDSFLYGCLCNSQESWMRAW